jgi:hypothetical protein
VKTFEELQSPTGDTIMLHIPRYRRAIFLALGTGEPTANVRGSNATFDRPDRLEGLAARRLLDALGTARQAVISAQTQVKVAGPVRHGCQMVTSAIDALAHLISGSPRYFHAQGTLGEPGEPNWTRDRQDTD